MSQINASLVKELRELTSAGMMDCKKALTETQGDIEQAIDWLRKKGLSSAAKKAARVASEGLIALSLRDGVGSMVEVNSETDFVARNAEFQEYAVKTAEVALTNGKEVEVLSGAHFPDSGRSVGEELLEMVARIGENMVLRRSARLEVEQGVVAGYLHNTVVPHAGKIGVLVGLQSTADKNALNEFGRKLAMHICAARPIAVNKDAIDEVLIERERAVLREQAQGSGKTPQIIEKMVEGRLRKYYEEASLEDQTYVVDGETKIKKVVEKFEKESGVDVSITEFVRFELGEGVEKETEDFAAEVAAQIKK
ncbi:MAG: elongation factor Ts [Rhodospirillaceae bacterium]|nr:elongation factor Ts [Rhodospirillaceae bacterium]